MYKNNNKAFQRSFNNEFEMELNPEFEMENDYEYGAGEEMEGSFDMESNGEDEYAPGYELEPEFDMEEEADYENPYNMEFDNEENEFQEEYENQQDEMELELEYVTNEQELSNWVNEVVRRTNPRLRRTLRTPLGQRAVKQISKIAFKTLPYIGRKRQGWKRPYHLRKPYYNRHGKPGYKKPQNRKTWGKNMNMPPQTFQNTNMPQQPQTFPNSDMSQQAFPNSNMPQQQQTFPNSNIQQPQTFPNSNMPQQPQTFPNSDMSQQQQGSQNTGTSQEPQIQQDGSFKNFVMDTIKNLSEQIAKGNESVMALKNSMTNSAVNNFPAIVQPKTDTPDQPAPNTQSPPVNDTSQKGAATPGEFEWEDYEHDNETDYEFDNETDYEYDNETDGEIIESESSFSEETEMELASELLSVNNEWELDHFLGKLLKRAVGGLSKILKSPAAALLKKAFSKIAGKALPILGGVIAGPVGAAAGNALGSAVASEFFNLELEGLSNEDSEFEVAKAFVRFAGNAAREAQDNETGNPAKDTEHAMIQAARRFAPGLLRRRASPYNQNPAMDYRYDQNNDNNNMGGGNGRWYRRGNKIIIQDAF